jgi:predicted membrane-bound spermidine synthase
MLCGIALLSGCAALLFETLWFRVAGLAFGNGVWASSIVLAAFMAGLAGGNLLAARLADRLARPIRFYAGLELAIGASGAALVLLLPSLTGFLAPLFRLLRDSPWLLNLMRLVISFALMVLPALAMGATLPVLVKALSVSDRRFGRVLGRLYGWNTLGAVAGSLLGEALLIGWLGIRGTAFSAAAINTAAALACLALARGAEAPRARRATPAAERPRLSSAGARLLLAAFLAGGVFLGLEVVWFRFLSLFVYGTSLVFAAMLAVVLVGISLGGLAASRWLRGGRSVSTLLPGLALLPACLVLACYAGFSAVFRVALVPGTAAASIPHVIFLSAPLMLPVAFLSGLLFTAIGDTAKGELGAEARTAGLLTLANTVGAALGALAAGFLLLPQLGIERSLVALSLGYAAIALCLWLPAPGALGWKPRIAVVPLAAALVGLLVWFPHGALRSRYLPHPTRAFLEPGSKIVAVREGLIETIVYLRTDRFGKPLHYRMFTDGLSMSSTTTHSRRYMKAFVYLPVAVHPELRRALLISYGVGSTAKALTDTTSLETIDVVDISPDILETSEIVFSSPAENPLNDPRVRVHVEDARFFLQTVDRKFDLITGEPPPPKYAGVVNLYSREYFRLIRDRLAEGGMTTYWLPVHSLSETDAQSIIRAFCDVFSDCTLWTGAGLDWMLVGTRGSQGPASAEQFGLQWPDPVVGPELGALGFERPEQLGAMFLAGSHELDALTRGVPPLVDEFPLRLSNLPFQPRDAHRSSLFRSLMDVRTAREQFRSSELIGRLWPATLRERTLESFRWQRIVNARLVYDEDVEVTEQDLYEVLTETPLRTLPLWMLGSEVAEQRLVEALSGRAAARPAVSRVRGIGALADRDYREAARWFGRARAVRKAGWRLTTLQIFALCMAGELERAAELARRLVRESEVAAESDAYWRWLEITFGLPDPRGPRRAEWPR